MNIEANSSYVWNKTIESEYVVKLSYPIQPNTCCCRCKKDLKESRNNVHIPVNMDETFRIIYTDGICCTFTCMLAFVLSSNTGYNVNVKYVKSIYIIYVVAPFLLDIENLLENLTE